MLVIVYLEVLDLSKQLLQAMLDLDILEGMDFSVESQDATP